MTNEDKIAEIRKRGLANIERILLDVGIEPFLCQEAIERIDIETRPNYGGTYDQS